MDVSDVINELASLIFLLEVHQGLEVSSVREVLALVASEVDDLHAVVMVHRVHCSLELDGEAWSEKVLSVFLVHLDDAHVSRVVNLHVMEPSLTF